MWKYIGKAKSETKRIERLKKSIILKKNEKKSNEPELVDLWGDNAPKGTEKLRNKPKPFVSCLPAIVLPHGGQSYNPSANYYKV